MKILHLATQDVSRGGGGFDAAYRLHSNMRNAGIDSHMMVLNKQSDDPDVTGVADHLSAVGKLLRFWYTIQRRIRRRILPGSSYFNIEAHTLVGANQLVRLFPFSPDVIVAHWVSGFVNTITLRDLDRMTNVPILWYLMDMAAFTGGCHYAFDCTGYTRQCGSCPQLGMWRNSRDLSYRQLNTRRACLQETNITAVAASSWLVDQVASASVFRDKRVETILLGIDVNVFYPGDREKARELLNIPARRKIIFFGAHSLDEERKGTRHLVGALKLLFAMLSNNVSLREQIIVVTAGHARNLEDLEIAFKHQHMGFLKGDIRLAAGYQAADVYVNASIEDSGPMMVNESLLCGTPVVSFEMGVAIDLVLTGQTGYRARLRDEQDMANGLRKILEMDDEAYSAMRECCRSHSLKLCHPDVQVDAFKVLCQELTSSRSARDR
jgi:glycosyltransferase involved in cell wall biosynthesis